MRDAEEAINEKSHNRRHEIKRSSRATSRRFESTFQRRQIEAHTLANWCPSVPPRAPDDVAGFPQAPDQAIARSDFHPKIRGLHVPDVGGRWRTTADRTAIREPVAICNRESLSRKLRGS
jgi:hypothetical protein